MSALFSPQSNTFARASVFTVGALGVLVVGAVISFPRTPYATGQHSSPVQPVQFDHRHHVGDEGIDCRYCHLSVETSPFAGIPPTSTCMGCHSQIWNKSATLEPVRRSYFENTPIRWERVNKLPDYVYFAHSIHVKKGVGCVTCHGRLDLMPTPEQATPLSMGWCLDCHRNPAPNLRPPEEVTSMTWQPSDDPAYGRALAMKNDVNPRISCTTCHR